MTWNPISLADLQAVLARDLVECSVGQWEFFRRAGIAPAKWRLAPWGDQGGGFKAVPVHSDRVLWYNDIEAVGICEDIPKLVVPLRICILK